MKVLRKIKKHSASVITHLRMHGHRYAGGMFAWFAVVKTVFMIASFFGLIHIGNTFADTPIVLNSSNIIDYCSLGDNECDISNAGITAIASGTFANYSWLHRLYLNNNHITSLGSGAFIGLSNLEELKIISSHLSFIESGTFISIPQLKQLYLDSNQLTWITKGYLVWLSGLKSLSLNLNVISSIESGAFQWLIHLHDLDLFWNRLTSLVPGDFIGLINLNALFLSQNKLISIVTGAFNDLTNLQRLILYGNKINTLTSGSFEWLSNLLTLELSSNKLTTIAPDTFNWLSTLVNLWLWLNPLTLIQSGTFNGLSHLQTLWVYSDQLASLDPHIFDGLSMLQELDISFNHLTTIDSRYFNNLPNLIDLNMYSDTFTSIASDTFDGLTNAGTIGIAPSCNTSGSVGVVFPNWTTSTDDTNCVVIKSIDSNDFITALGNNTYTLIDGYYLGNLAISFNYPHMSNTFLSNVAMQSYYRNIDWDFLVDDYPAQVKYASWTHIIDHGSAFTGVLHSPVLFDTGTIPWLSGLDAVIRFWALTHRVDFNQFVKVRIPVSAEQIGNTVQIYSSDVEDVYDETANWTLERMALVVEIDGNPYVEFTTTHAWRYAVRQTDQSVSIATNVMITGNVTIGSVLTGSYIYSGIVPEGNSLYQWYRDAVAITWAIGMTYVVTPSDIQKTIVFQVIPVSQLPEQGVMGTSDGLYIPYQISPIILTHYGPQSSYTTNRLANTCATGTMQIVNISDNTGWQSLLSLSGYALAANTMYLFDSGVYTLGSQVSADNCTSIVGSGAVTIQAIGYWYNQSTAMIYANSKQNIIIDNVKLDGNGTQLSFWINTDGVSSSTINNVDLGNSMYYGIRLNASAHNNTVNNTTVHNINNYAIFIRSYGYNNVISNCTVYSAGQNGIIVNDHSTNNVVENSQVYNSYYGIHTSMTSANNIFRNLNLYNNTSYGAYIESSSNILLDKLQVHGNASHGIYFVSSPYGTVNNTQVYNNVNGISFGSASSYGTINDSQVFNNSNFGITFGSSYGTVNNSQSYNNSLGLGLSSSPNASINNFQAYNNTNGIYISSSGVINNVWSYNNSGYGISMDTIALNRYYGNNKVFNNASPGIIWNTAALITGNDGLLGWTTGTMDQTTSMSWEYMTNPANCSGNYLLNRSWTFASVIGRKTFTTTSWMQYSYGSGILTQTQPIMYSWTDLIISWTYTGTAYIWSSLGIITGSISGMNTYSKNQNIIISTTVSAPATMYNIYGDIVSFISAKVNNESAGITLSGGLMTNRVIIQMYDPTHYFAMHFEKDTHIDTTPPTIPTLISPISGSIFITWMITFLRSWSIDTGAWLSGYLYQVSADAWFTNSIYSWMSITTGISLTGMLNGIYYRRVLAYDAIGNTWARSAPWNMVISSSLPTPPQLLSPTSGTIFNTWTIHLQRSWAINTGGSIGWYQYQISDDVWFLDILSSWTTAATGISLTWCRDGMQYRRVLAFDAVGNTWSRSNIWNLLVDTTAPTIPDLLSPISGTIFTTWAIDMLRSWSIDTGAGMSGYFFQMSRDSGFTDLIISWNTVETGISVIGFPDGLYYRRVLAFDAVGNTWSRNNIWNLLVDTTAPTIPDLLSPISGTIFTTWAIDMLRSGSIDTGAGVSGYLYQVSSDSGFINFVISWNQIDTWISLMGFTDGTYYWRVAAFDTVGHTWSRSSGRNFVVDTTVINSGTIIPPSVPTGWGGSMISKDICPVQRDCSSSYYDHVCWPCPTTGTHGSATTSWSIQNSPYSSEFNSAYQRSYANGITTIPTIQQANINGKVTREQLAKMITQYAIKVMHKKADTKLSCVFPDILHESAEMRFYIKTSCQLGLMWREADGLSIKKAFDPKQNVTRAQFSTVVSRMLYGEKYNTSNFQLRYARHLQALHAAGIINDISKPNADELRGYIMLILWRTIKWN